MVTGASEPWIACYATLLQYLRGGFLASRWLSVQRRSGIDAILAYEPTSPMLLSLSRFARANRVPLILDLAEWHDGSHLPGGRFGLRSADGALRMRYLYARTSYVIAISSYLANFYRTKGCSVIRVPPLVDLTEPKWQTTPSQSPGLLRLVYAGTPGKKDLLANIIHGLTLLGNYQQHVQLQLIGVTLDQVTAMLGVTSISRPLAANTIVCRGRVPQACVPQMLAACDYSVLLRPHRRYAEAGFPTKIVESLSAGLPVIANMTSDLSEYLQDLDQGVVVRGYSPGAFAKAVERVLTLPGEQHRRMRERAKARAMASFDYRAYATEIGQFVSEAIQNGN